MAVSIEELITKLSEFPNGWRVYATRSGGSLEVWDPSGPKYSYVFTDDRETRHFESRRHSGEVMSRREETKRPKA